MTASARIHSRISRHAGAVLLLSLLSLLVFATAATPAQAAPVFPEGDMTIVIHKFEQPNATMQVANGLPQDMTGYTPVEGAGFTAKHIPGIDLATTAGQQAASTFSVADATDRVSSEPVVASGATDANGDVSFTPLMPGLYFIEETVTPQGFIGSAPFIVALPLTDPIHGDRWLSTVHVYPKNARVGISLAVDDQSAVSNGDPITWTARASIPNQASLDGYAIQNIFAAEVILDGRFSDIQVGITGVAALLQYGDDYTVREARIDGRWAFEVFFTPVGLAKLSEARQADPQAETTVTYRAHVTGPGEHANEARIVIGGDSLASSVALTKFGPLKVLVHERGYPTHTVAGVEFQLYLTAEDALAGQNPVTVGGLDRWTSAADGTIVIDSLRFSGFVNGLERDSSDPLFRHYYIVPIGFPEGWTGVIAPISMTVSSSTEAEVGIVELWRSTAGDELETTGASASSLAIGAALLVGLGALLILRRRSSNTTKTEARQ